MSKYNRNTGIGFLEAVPALVTVPVKAGATILIQAVEALPVVQEHLDFWGQQANFALHRAEQQVLRTYSDALGRRVTKKDFESNANCEKFAEELAFADWEEPKVE